MDDTRVGQDHETNRAPYIATTAVVGVYVDIGRDQESPRKRSVCKRREPPMLLVPTGLALMVLITVLLSLVGPAGRDRR